MGERESATGRTTSSTAASKCQPDSGAVSSQRDKENDVAERRPRGKFFAAVGR